MSWEPMPWITLCHGLPDAGDEHLGRGNPHSVGGSEQMLQRRLLQWLLSLGISAQSWLTWLKDYGLVFLFCFQKKSLESIRGLKSREDFHCSCASPCLP